MTLFTCRSLLFEIIKSKVNTNGRNSIKHTDIDFELKFCNAFVILNTFNFRKVFSIGGDVFEVENSSFKTNRKK